MGGGAILGCASAGDFSVDDTDLVEGDVERSMTALVLSSESDDRPRETCLSGVLNGLIGLFLAIDADNEPTVKDRRCSIFALIFSFSDFASLSFLLAAAFRVAASYISAQCINTLAQYFAAPVGLVGKVLLNHDSTLLGYTIFNADVTCG